jgi:hypothetical protein
MVAGSGAHLLRSSALAAGPNGTRLTRRLVRRALTAQRL